MKKIGKRVNTDQKNVRRQALQDEFGDIHYKYYGRMKVDGKWSEKLLRDVDDELEAAILLKKMKEGLVKTAAQDRELTITTCIKLANKQSKKLGKVRLGCNDNDLTNIRRHLRPYWDGTNPDSKETPVGGKSLIGFNLADYKEYLEGKDVHYPVMPKRDGTVKELSPRKGLAQNTVKHNIHAVCKLLRAAGISFSVPDLPVKNLQEYRFTDTQIAKLFEIAEKRGGDLPDMLTFFANTGGRRSELVKLRWQDVDFDNDIITFEDTKNGKDHEMPLNQELKTCLLKRKLRVKTSEYVFAGRTGGMRCKSAVSRLFSRLKKAAGLPKEAQPVHGLRAMFASRLSNQGVPIATIKELLNHGEISTTMRYIRVDEDQKREAVSDLGVGYQEVKNG